MYHYNLGLLFNIIAEKQKDRPAIIFSETNNVSFRELNDCSNQIARHLLGNGIKKNDVIGIFHDKTFYGFALMIACLKIGVIYVNLDISSPFERLKKIIDKCKPSLLTYRKQNPPDRIGGFQIHLLEIDSEVFIDQISKYSCEKLDQTLLVCSDNPAYIMFTSGSTGFPKGAVMTHQNLLNFINWAKQVYEIEESDIMTNVNPMYFDNSVFDFYASLFNGASMLTVDSDTVQNPLKLVSYVDRFKASIWFSVPSLLVFLLTIKVLTKDAFSGLRIITFGGEGFPKPKLKYLFDLFSDRIRIVNVYGPTECSCICSAYDIRISDFDDMKSLAPLGYMAPNFDYLILDERNNPSKIGELILSGPQVGLGYYNDPERTKTSFIQHPLIENYSKTVYKTGDIVKEDANGMLHITGRVDNQIKYMGYRIELEEIEAGFSSLEYIKEVGVIYQKFENGLGQIKAYVSLKRNMPVETIKNDIRNVIPVYMVPKEIYILDTIPKNNNGKIDRLALKNLN